MNEDEEYEKLLKAYYSCFIDNDSGIRVMADLQNKFYKRTFITNPVDASSILCNEGARSVVVYILSKIEEMEMQYGRRK